MTDVQLQALAKAIAPVMRDYIARHTQPLADHIKALESRPAIAYKGAWRSGERYAEGALVSRGGGLWLALRETVSTPGTDNSGWRLVVKEGQAR